MIKQIRLFAFKPQTEVPTSIYKLFSWWGQERAQNPSATPTNEFDIHIGGDIVPIENEAGLRAYHIWLKLGEDHKWLMSRL